MPQVPHVPGVPRLTSYSAGAPSLLFSDIVNVVGLLAPSQWGIFLDGVPVIQPATALTSFAAASLAPIQQIASLLGAPNIVPCVASTVEFDFAQEFPISNYPQEQGAFQSYNKVTLPYDVKVRLASGGSTSQRQAFIQTILGVSQSLELFDVVTPELTFASVNCMHIAWRRESRNGVTLLQPELWFQKIQVTSTATFSNTQQPAEAGQVGVGNVQPQAPTLAIQSGIQAVTGGGGAF